MYIAKDDLHKNPVVLTAAFVFTLLPLYYGSWQYRITHASQILRPHQHTSIWSEAFLDEWLETQVIEPFDPWPLQQFCNRSTWRPDLIFNLQDANGGIGNVRSNLLDFLLYAIEAGASIMMPS